MSERDANCWMECTADACRQGRLPCPTPQACQLPERTPLNGWDFALAAFICSVCFGFVALGPMTLAFVRSFA